MAMIRNDEAAFTEKADKAFSQADQLRDEQLVERRKMLSVKQKNEARELKRLVKIKGEANPRVLQLKARQQVNHVRQTLFDEEIEKSKIQVPVIDEKTWMVHGRVLDANRKPVRGLTVGVATPTGEWIQDLGYACTDQRGYFSLKYKLSKTETEKLKIISTHRTLDVSASAQANVEVGYFNRQVVLIVSNQAQKIIYVDKQLLLIRPGTIDYREIVLKDEYPCTPPRGGDKPGIVDPEIIKYWGRVTDDEGKGIKGLSVAVADKDHVYTETFPPARTDDEGNFELKFNVDKYKDVIAANPNLFLKVTDKRGEVVLEDKKRLRLKAGGSENIDMTIKRKAEEPTPAPEETHRETGGSNATSRTTNATTRSTKATTRSTKATTKTTKATPKKATTTRRIVKKVTKRNP